MKKSSSVLATGLLSLTLVFSTGAGAFAAQQSGSTFEKQSVSVSISAIDKPDLSGIATPLPVDAEMAKKMTLALETANSIPGTTSAQKSEIARELKTLKMKQPKAVAAAQNSFSRVAKTASTVPSLRSLSINHVAQTKGFYCGPASAYMILKYKGKTKSADKKISLSHKRILLLQTI